MENKNSYNLNIFFRIKFLTINEGVLLDIFRRKDTFSLWHTNEGNLKQGKLVKQKHTSFFNVFLIKNILSNDETTLTAHN